MTLGLLGLAGVLLLPVLLALVLLHLLSFHALLPFVGPPASQVAMIWGGLGGWLFGRGPSDPGDFVAFLADRGAAVGNILRVAPQPIPEDILGPEAGRDIAPDIAGIVVRLFAKIDHRSALSIGSPV